jgi:hypothetical protein
MSGQFNASAALAPEKNPGTQEGRWAPQTVWTLRRKVEFLTPSGFETQTVQPVAWSLYRLSYTGAYIS